MVTLALLFIAPVRATAADEAASKSFVDSCRVAAFSRSHSALTTDREAILFCDGFVRGFSTAKMLWAPQLAYCVPAGISVVEMEAAYITWIDAHPERKSHFMVETFLDAMRATFPCSK